MELQLDSRRNNQEFLKEILDEISYSYKLINLRDRFPYHKNGIRLYDLNKLPSKKRKKEIIEHILTKVKYNFDFLSEARLFSFKRQFNNYIMYCHVEIDETSIGGHFGVYIYNLDFENYLFGGQLDSLLKDLYNIEIETYRYCAITEDDVKETTYSILQIFEDIFDELKRRLSL